MTNISRVIETSLLLRVANKLLDMNQISDHVDCDDFVCFKEFLGMKLILRITRNDEVFIHRDYVWKVGCYFRYHLAENVGDHFTKKHNGAYLCFGDPQQVKSDFALLALI